jgi:hypothetical protein
MPTTVYSLNTGADSTAIVEADLSAVGPTFNFDGNADMNCERVAGVTDRVMWMKLTDFSDITPGAEIVNATIRLYRSSGFASGGAVHDIRQCLRDVLVSQLSGNLARTGVPWTTVGALDDGTDRSASVIDTLPVDNTNGYKEASGSGLVTLFQDWFDGAVSNFGLLIFPDPTKEVYSTFSQSEGTDGQRPEIILEWNAPSGGAASGYLGNDLYF